MTFDEKMKQLETMDMHCGTEKEFEKDEKIKELQIAAFQKAIKCAERVVRTLEDGLAKVKTGEDMRGIDCVLEYVLANEDAAFIELGNLAKVHSDPMGGEQFARFDQAEMPEPGLFKENENEYRMILPPFRSIQYRGNCEYKAEGISQMVRDCCLGYEKRTGIKLVPEGEFSKVTITNYVKKYSGDTVDPGNMDCKAAVDAMQGFLIRGDSVNDIEILCRGKISEDGKAFTEIRTEKVR